MKVSLLALILSMLLMSAIHELGYGYKSVGNLFIAPSKEIKHFTLGYDEIIADSLWLRLIQDYDFCEQDRAANLNQPTEGLGRTPNCESGWAFHMLDAITELAPEFRMPYATGGLALSIMVDDRTGAKVIFDKAIERFPNDWPILYRAAYFYLIELEQPKTAADLLVRAGDLGGPFWLHALAAKLYTQVGRAALAQTVLLDYLKVHGDKPGAKRIRERLAEVEQVLEQEGPNP